MSRKKKLAKSMRISSELHQYINSNRLYDEESFNSILERLIGFK